MSSFVDAIEVDAPAERAFELVANPRHLPRIDPGATVRLLSGEWTSIGSRHHVTSRVGGALVDSVHEITRFEPPHLVEERITARGTVMIGTTEVRAVGGERSVVTVRGEVEWGGSLIELVSRLLQPLTGPPSRRRALDRIKQVVESTDLATLERQPHLGEEG